MRGKSWPSSPTFAPPSTAPSRAQSRLRSSRPSAASSRSAERLLAALGREDLSLDGAALGAAEGGAKVGELGQLFPRVEAEAPAA